MNASSDELLSFAAEPPPAEENPALNPWKILVVDDEEEVHRVTRLALGDISVHGRPLQFIDAYSGREWVEIMRHQPDIAMVLMDVVMETEHAGLDAVQAIRHDLKNRFVRIVLRTGQPGQAPEHEVVRRFDINDYKEKTELTTTKLYTLLHTGLSLHRELVAMDQARNGLEQVITASAAMFEQQSLERLQRGLLQQLAALLYARRDAVIVSTGITAAWVGNGLRIVAGTGRYEGNEGQLAEDVLAPDAIAHIGRAFEDGLMVVGEHHFAVHFATRAGNRHVVYLTSESRFEPSDVRLVQLFCRNVTIAFENLALNAEIRSSQRQLILLLSAAIEERSPELRHHVQRVSQYAMLLGRLLGLDSDSVDALGVAAGMHDLGKIGVPDSVLNKPGALDAFERRVMESHVERGQAILQGQQSPLLKQSELAVAQHHEHWDGGGYPRGLRGEETDLFARITGLVDVFDALTTRRCYKDAWTVPQVVDYLREQRGRQFDPRLVDLFLDNLPEFVEIAERLAAPTPPQDA
ncbi:MAG TPA: HD domain-containing phosphohydrolase [Solimonas sp.]|nr:HD domain-containing phosphohydrolase [Solimonas sp.]